MKLIPKYITVSIVSATLLVLLVLMGLEVLISFIGQLGHIGQGHYGLLQAGLFVLLAMPYQLYSFFPMASLIGSLLGLGALASHSELMVMQAAGFSKMQIIRTVLIAAMLIAGLGIILGEIIAPYAEDWANMEQTLALSGGQALNTQQGLWMRQKNQFVHINRVENRHQLSGVSIYQFNQYHQLIHASFAKSASFVQGVWQLNQVKQTQLYPTSTLTQFVNKKAWVVQIDPDILSVSDDLPENMSLIKLWDYIQYLNRNGLESQQYQMNFWKRVFQPVATAIMIFLALPFVFGSLRNVTVGVRMLAGITVGFLFYILNQFFAPISLLYQVPPLLGAALPTVLFFIAALVAALWRRA